MHSWLEKLVCLGYLGLQRCPWPTGLAETLGIPPPRARFMQSCGEACSLDTVRSVGGTSEPSSGGLLEAEERERKVSQEAQEPALIA